MDLGRGSELAEARGDEDIVAPVKAVRVGCSVRGLWLVDACGSVDNC